MGLKNGPWAGRRGLHRTDLGEGGGRMSACCNETFDFLILERRVGMFLIS